MYSKRSEPRPNIPNPTTLKPITDPPLNAMFNADSKFCRAALVVRLLDFVATLIPKNPARPEAVAPTKNESDISALDSLFL